MLAELKRFIAASNTGRRRRPDGHRIKKGTVDTYHDFSRLLHSFEETNKMALQLCTNVKYTATVFKREKAYWARFHRLFMEHLYGKGFFDNYIATQHKILRTFLRYLHKEKGWPLSSFLPTFQVGKEQLPVIVFSPNQLHFFIHDTAFTETLTPAQKRIKDIVIAGCTVALRISDLMSLTKHNLVQKDNRYYLTITSKKTQTSTSLLLPDYVTNIFLHYCKYGKHLLPPLSKVNINKQIKQLAKQAGWQETIGKTRMQRGIAKQQFKSKDEQFRFCDLVSSHTMRRTAITTMLILGMPEGVVREISGHAPGSKEFFRYVAYSRSYMDQSVQLYHNKMQDKQWHGV